MKSFIKSLTLSAALAFSTTTVTAATQTYGLGTGTQAPAFNTKDIAGDTVKTADLIKKGPLVLVFYRGGWCPFCNLELAHLQGKLVPALAKMNGTLVAISVDVPKEGVATKNKHSLTMKIVSDPKHVILDQYKVTYHMPDELVKKYKDEYKLDIEASSGEKHHNIAVPATYVIDGSGKITYAYVNEDYKVRAPFPEVLAAVEKAKSAKSH